VPISLGNFKFSILTVRHAVYVFFFLFLSLLHVKTWRKENLSLACRYVKLSSRKIHFFLLSIQLILYNLFVLKHFTNSSA
ncbi:hypothetical protein C1645_760793, partial [Glomus cerebriforme]